MSGALRPYSAYKESGVSWLGQIPEKWQTLPALAAYQPKLVKNMGMIESTVLSLSYGRIIVKSPDTLHGLVPESFETYQIVDPGDIIVRTTDLQNDRTSLRVGRAGHRGIITSAYMCLQTKGLMSSEFGYQFLNAYDLLKIIYGYGSGLRQNLDFNEIKRMPVLVPPKEDQSAIVRFLRHADQNIHRFIRAKQKLIRLLEEQKQTIICRAVTRGLDLGVPLKPSHVEWLGDIPAHWDTRRAKYLFREVDHRSDTGAEVLLSLRMYQGLVPHNEVSSVPISSEALVGFKKVRSAQLVMNRMRAAIGMFGVARQPGIVSPDYAVLEPLTDIDQSYFLYLFKTPIAGAVFRIESKGLGTGSSGFMRLYTDRFGTIKLPVPPLQEQRQIVKTLQESTAELNNAQDRARHEVALIQEYRTRLIADVVTGKIDVREVAANLTDEDDLSAELQMDDTIEALREPEDDQADERASE